MISSSAIKNLSLLLLLGCSPFWALQAQEEATATPTGAFTLEQCIGYALQNHPSIKAANIDVQISEAVVGETKSMGLPQVNGQLQVIDNYQIQTQFLPAVFFADDPVNNPPPADAAPIGVRFGTQYNGDFNITLSQLIFDGTYFLGLKAADTYTELAKKAVNVTKADITSNVTKAYYGVLIARERKVILDEVLGRLERMLEETKALYKNGFVEELDVDRLEVTYNNMLSDKMRLVYVEKSSMTLLKFQLGMDITADLELEGSIAQTELKEQLIDAAGFNPEDRPEYGVMQIQRDLDLMNIKRYKVGYYPSVSAFARRGFNSGTNTFQQHKLNDDTWFGYGALGLTVSIPIFDGFLKKHQIQHAKLDLQKTELQMANMENAFAMEQNTSMNSLQSNIQQLQSQAKNRDLAMKVVQKTAIKYQEGVGASLEVINAESDLATATNNYYAALYEALIAKVDYDKSMGRLVTPAP